jgi:tungstate transport system substrate-binding protein
VTRAATAAALMILSATPAGAEDGGGLVVLASTIGPIDAGIVSVLEEAFERETGIRVRHVGAGTGEALKIAQGGSVDLVLVHAKALEERFVEDGYGTERIPFMYNDFVIVGPPADPAGVRGTRSATEALRAVASKGAPFVSRGDRSGTHVAEMELWSKAGVAPSGSWYVVYEKGSEGNAATLRYTDQRQAYTVIDRATWLTLKSGSTLAVLLEKDEALLNFITLIPVSPKKFPKVNQRGATRFVQWLTAPDKGQRIVEQFGVERYGAPMFFPNSQEWKAMRAKPTP